MMSWLNRLLKRDAPTSVESEEDAYRKHWDDFHRDKMYGGNPNYNMYRDAQWN